MANTKKVAKMQQNQEPMVNKLFERVKEQDRLNQPAVIGKTMLGQGFFKEIGKLRQVQDRAYPLEEDDSKFDTPAGKMN